MGNRMYLVLGDPSHDGHGKYRKVLVETNKSVVEIQDAYRASCKKTGLCFDGRAGYKYNLCAEYEDNRLTGDVLRILEEYKFPVNELNIDEDDGGQGAYIDEDEFVALWFWFVKLSLPDMEYHLPKDDKIPVINGWGGTARLNAEFGYGLYR